MGEHIVLRGVTKTYTTATGPVRAVEDITLSVGEQEFLTVLGPSGCGKSTVLAMLGGLLAPDAGTITINGTVLRGPDPRLVAMVFQDPGLFPWRTALYNVCFGPELLGVPPREREALARRLLESVGLAGFERKYPRELSGGMRQRVAIARALALGSPILLMDEPFGALDEQTRLLMGEWLGEIRAQARKTIVFVTHSIQEAIALSDRIVVMTARPGRVKDIVPVPLPFPRDLNTPEAAALRARLWQQIREESLRAMAQNGS
ncbi:MAG: ABC transporter ATP-binding protein [Armatimonadota bacterium]|nr:ABC transporter ATP-binding protein [Armatimonadota bacterium]MDR7532999.1 ABC transporter ATP-binding protein [Armatimonadota bacterium]MDR7537601.1 ABC transporter ATP-binding protein [Armatimonadota bacterium]